MNLEESTMQFDDFVKYQAWLLEFDPELKAAFDNHSDIDEGSDT